MHSKKRTTNFKSKKRRLPIAAQFQNAACELKLGRAQALASINEINQIRRKMKTKEFARFDDYLEAFGETAMIHLTAKWQNPKIAEEKALKLIEIIRQARWINMRAGINRAAERSKE